MVKCSFLLSFAVCAVVGTSVLAEAVDTGSALNDTSASADAGVTTDVTTDTSASTAADVADVTTDTSASIAADVAGVTTDTSASTAANVADVADTSAAAIDVTAPVAGNAAPVNTAVEPTPTVASPTNDTVKVTVSATKPAATVKAGPTLIGGQVTLVPGYADCGGVGFDYTVYMPEESSTSEFTRLTCEASYRCQDVEGSDVYQCKEWPSRDPVAFYGQCGGGNYDGQMFCAPGAVCKYISASFSQCLPTY